MKLTCLKGKNAGVVLKFSPPGIFIGRHEDNDIRILEDGISQYHAKIIFEDGKWVLYDLGSTNGTMVNVERVEGSKVLKSRDVIYFATEAYRFECDSDEALRLLATVNQHEALGSVKLRGHIEIPLSDDLQEQVRATKPQNLTKRKTHPSKIQKEIAEARIIRNMIDEAVREKRKRLNIIMFIIALLLNLALLALWLPRRLGINIEDFFLQ